MARTQIRSGHVGARPSLALSALEKRKVRQAERIRRWVEVSVAFDKRGSGWCHRHIPTDCAKRPERQQSLLEPVDASLALPVSAGVFTLPVRGQLVIVRRSSLRHTLAQPSSAPLLASSEPMTPPSIPLQNLFKSPRSSAYTSSSGVFVKVLRRPIEITTQSGHSRLIQKRHRRWASCLSGHTLQRHHIG